MREAIHALRCIFWCLRSTQSTRIDQTVLCNGAVLEKTVRNF
ncbi:hypothetical protein GBAR_LOCUS30540 [Geodia barretti]|uniref:Uncharacterized protein n=1 Tax=Geodia barretti TaxID=519541 RepID=A0AA35XKH7_GEOBA|nr:hypothetical protein GBAR_LOCUS30540 [Geodia barretti]